MHLRTTIQEIDLALHAMGAQVHLLQQRQPEAPDHENGRPTWEGRGGLTSDQVGALPYHLAYWSGAVAHDNFSAVSSALARGAVSPPSAAAPITASTVNDYGNRVPFVLYVQGPSSPGSGHRCTVFGALLRKPEVPP